MKGEQKVSIDDSALAQAGITEQEVLLLSTFKASTEWSALKKLMKYFKFQSDLKLRSPSSSLEEIRHHQGRLGALNELANFVEVDLAEWYNLRTRSKGGR